MILIDYASRMTSTESEKEVHTFADKWNIKREWYVQKGTTGLKHPHYELPMSPLVDKMCEEDCAELVTPRELERKGWWNK